MLNSAIDELASTFRALLPWGEVAVEHLPRCTTIALPPAAGADYRFLVELFNQGGAILVAQPLSWALPAYFEFMDWDPAVFPSLQAADVLTPVKQLVSHPTRVFSQRGWLRWRFTCEVFEGGAWSRIGAIITSSRGPAEAGQKKARVLTLSSPPLIAASLDAT